MYNFNFMKDEELIEVFDNAWVTQNNQEKNTTIALTNKRILFMDYDSLDPQEVMRIGRGADYVRYKEVYYYIDLKDIKSLEENDYYIINLKKSGIGFDNEKLHKLLQHELSRLKN